MAARLAGVVVTHRVIGSPLIVLPPLLVYAALVVPQFGMVVPPA